LALEVGNLEAPVSHPLSPTALPKAASSPLLSTRGTLARQTG